jgi:hypothetical protein
MACRAGELCDGPRVGVTSRLLLRLAIRASVVLSVRTQLARVLVLGDELRTLECLLLVPLGGSSTERESVGMNSRIRELNCERAIPYHTVLSD